MKANVTIEQQKCKVHEERDRLRFENKFDFQICQRNKKLSIDPVFWFFFEKTPIRIFVEIPRALRSYIVLFKVQKLKFFFRKQPIFFCFIAFITLFLLSVSYVSMHESQLFQNSFRPLSDIFLDQQPNKQFEHPNS